MRTVITWYRGLSCEVQGFLQVSVLITLLQLVVIGLFLYFLVMSPVSRSSSEFINQSMLTINQQEETYEFHF